ncbi:TonB-dependent siderophore receptor [Pandoraea anapnoica]|uniref:TonB-dependent siderophore receptor n=2 Tax=Pandoraea anapnoica TaxID=2508301 RepID=A0A5E5AM28_9BURK|nr:TonB-dependent siderophore receptor [Pandoraea anapnoica]
MVRGIQQANGQITDAWNVFAGYTFNTTKYLADATSQGQSFADFAPRHLFRLWTNYELPFDGRRWGVGAGLIGLPTASAQVPAQATQVAVQNVCRQTSANAVLRGTYQLAG